MKKTVFYFDPKATKMFVEVVNEEGEKKRVISSPYNFVARAEIVARVIDIQDEDDIPTRIDGGYEYYNVAKFLPLKVDSGVYYDGEERAYKAAEFGFIIYANGKLRLISLLSVTRDRVKAYSLIHPTKFGKIPTYKDIESYMYESKIITSVGENNIEKQLKKIDVNTPKLSRILIAQGKEPLNGHQEYYVPITSFEKKAGEILADGRIDFKEVGAIIQVVKHQELLTRVPLQKPVDGYDVYGVKAPAEIEEVTGYKKGQNIEKSPKEENIFVASIDGCIDVDGKTVSVLPVAYINGDVDYDTGNIDFNGSVHIKGSILPGFTVKASGDIIVEKNVDDAFVKSDGDMTIMSGITGKGSAKIECGGNLTAKYLLNTKAEVTEDVMISDSIINSDVFSNKRINVVAKQGKIIGGKTTALYDITVNVAGAPNETSTVLTVGRNLFVEKELDVIRKEITKWRTEVNETIRKLKVSYGEGVFENPKEYLSYLPAVKKKNCLLLLKELNDGNKELKSLTEQSKEIEQKLKLDQDPVIAIKDKIYPGVVLNIKKSVRKVEERMDNVKFYEDPEEKVIRFTSAS
ncbi:DUF342 domain-containing protein [Spirochaetota bacterium]